jgi:hypothetical protein
MDEEKGILTIAHTRERYIKQAISLAQSVRVHNPDIPIAIATDKASPKLDEWFDEVVNWDFGDSGRLTCTLWMDKMTPLDRTLYIDADSLVTRSLGPVFQLFEGCSFSVYAKGDRGVPSWFEDIDKVKDFTGKDRFAGFNGGLMYFEMPDATDVFQTARELIGSYEELSISLMNGHKNDEPLISLSMAINDASPSHDEKLDVMVTSGGRRGPIEIDVLEGQCQFNKKGRIVEPIIMHFASDDDSYPYIRERLRLQKHFERGEISNAAGLSIELRARAHDLTKHFLPIWSQIFRNKAKEVWYG